MSKKLPRCDACSKRIRSTHHEFVLRDFETGMGQLRGLLRSMYPKPNPR